MANTNIAASSTLAAQYMAMRNIPSSNLLNVALTADITNYQTTVAQLQTAIYAPLAAKVTALRNAGEHINYVVMMYGTPYLINDGSSAAFNGYSVDGVLSQAPKAFPSSGGIGNPYYGQSGAFSATSYNLLLVTRLDGRSVSDVQSLITQSAASDGTHPNGEFFFDVDPDRTGDYEIFNTYMQSAQSDLAAAHFDAQIDTTTTFVAPASALAGYTSWGSNDYHFSFTAYHALHFLPGAIAETAVSTSASNIRTPGGGQSQIADLIHQGVTGVHGDVTEPYLDAIPNPDYVFPNYVKGRTLAEAFYSGIIPIIWKEIVIGDPICHPYPITSTSGARRHAPAAKPIAHLPL